MIGTLDIKVNAANPNLPLATFFAFVNSPSHVRVINVPRKIGSWSISTVYLTANYPDNTSRSVSCTLTGGCWHATLPASTAVGTAANGFAVTADGVSEDGTTAVTGYVLGKGDLEILSTDATVTVGTTTYYAHILDAQPTTPHKGDMCVIDSVWKLYNGTAWISLGGVAEVDWSNITNKPSSFTPSTHASSHGSSGTDPITPAAIGAETSGAAASAVAAHNTAAAPHPGKFDAAGAATSAVSDHDDSSSAHADLFAAKRDRTDNTCHETTSGFSPWFATPPSGYTFGDAQPTFDSTSSKWTWYVEGSSVAVDAESGTSTASATSATFTFNDSETKTFTATRFAATEATENETFVTKSYVALQFSSDNTSLVSTIGSTIASRCASLDPATSSIADIINALKGN